MRKIRRQISLFDTYQDVVATLEEDKPKREMREFCGFKRVFRAPIKQLVSRHEAFLVKKPRF